METLADNSRQPGSGGTLWPGGAQPARARRAAAGPRATVLGSLTIPGRPDQVGLARAFVARTVGSSRVGANADEATLLTSEIVTNAIQHTKSGTEGGTVTIVIIGIPQGVLVEIIDNGAAGAPIVKGDLYAVEGHGLFLVQRLAAQWGFLREPAGTTVWFHLPATGEPQQAAQQPSPDAGRSPDPPGRPDRPRPERSRTRPTRPIPRTPRTPPTPADPADPAGPANPAGPADPADPAGPADAALGCGTPSAAAPA
jgi:anti-sigma regulatory factor (Ser/Thr protein kinase)